MFTDGLRLLENNNVSKLVALERGLNVDRRTRWNYLASNEAIKRLTTRLDNLEYTVGEFLEAASYQIENIHNRMYNQIVNVDSEDEDVDGLVPAWLPPDEQEPVVGRGRGRGRGAVAARGRGAARGRAPAARGRGAARGRAPAARVRGAARGHAAPRRGAAQRRGQRRGRRQGVGLLPPVPQLVSS